MAARKPEKQEGVESTRKPKTTSLVCGLVMPISALDGCSAEHWGDVKAIITEAVEGIPDPRFAVRLVSDADDVGVIQKRIVQNLYSSDIVVCDVSGKNPNAMFELGMRLAFDKPTVIVKDDKTDYAFDTGIIEHIPYPRDLRFNRIVTFKALLAEKICGTYAAAKASADHSPFLKNFGKFRVSSLTEDVLPADKVVAEMFTELQVELARIRRALPRDGRGRQGLGEGTARVYDALTQYLFENPKATASELLGTAGFISEMERTCDAPQFFESPMAFRAVLDRAIRDLTQTRG